MVTNKEKMLLRDLARRQSEYAAMDCNLEKIREWKRHRRFEKGRPMVVLEIGGFRDEVYRPRLCCESALARQIETQLYSNFLNYEIFRDDKVVPDYFAVYYKTWFRLFGQEIRVTNAGAGIGHKFEHIVGDLEEDYSLLKESEYGIDRMVTSEYRNCAEDILGDILPVKSKMGALCAVPTQGIIHIMGLQNFIYAMYDYPELVQEMMMRTADDYIAFFQWLETENFLLETNGCEYLGQGSCCYTDELKSEGGTVTLRDVWGYLDSQESSSISPEMYGEFIFPAYRKIADVFGLLSYGCCEPVHPIWDKYISELSNLRNVSISAWCDQEYMGERLRERKVIYQRKPSANFLAVDVELQEAAVRKHMRETLHAARGCLLEITQRDVLTIHHNERKCARYVEIIKEEIEKGWSDC